MQLNLEIEEVNAILATLGNLPTSSGAYPLMMKIKQQGEEQANKPVAEPYKFENGQEFKE